MHYLTILLLLFTTAIAKALPADNNYLYKRSGLLPSDDPFYTPPADLENYTPGTILRSRPFLGKVGFFNFPINLAAAYQLLYRTTGSSGEAISTVTTILIPNNADFTSLLSYQAEINAAWSGCFPSYVLQAGNQNADNPVAEYSMLLYISVLSRGWIVALPDHEGPNAAFGIGPLGGHCVLDSIRAVLQSGSLTGISTNARTVMWGYSGGALPTEWALEEHATYAPELSIAGAALGGLPGNVTWTLFNRFNGKIPAGLIAAAIWGLAAGYPEISPLIQANLVQDKESAFRKVLS
jgi:hypothetical protein